MTLKTEISLFFRDPVGCGPVRKQNIEGTVLGKRFTVNELFKILAHVWDLIKCLEEDDTTPGYDDPAYDLILMGQVRGHGITPKGRSVVFGGSTVVLQWSYCRARDRTVVLK